MTAEPPFEAGAVQEQSSWVSPGVQETPVGADGVPYGICGVEDVEYAESPAAFVAES